MADPELLALWRENITPPAHRPVKDELSGNNVTTYTQKGNTKAYTVSRLKNDYPEIFEKVNTIGTP